MSERVLTIDLGNSRCKLVLWDRAQPAQPLDEREIPTSLALSIEPFARFIEEWIPRGSGLVRIGLSSVAALTGEQTVASTLRARFGDRFVERPDSGLENACSEPERVGRDRLFAARGALEIVRASAIVVDAGTALTVDALRVSADGASGLRGRFEGGAIAPGPRLLADALARHAARLPLVDPAPGARALGRVTLGALQSQCLINN
jgi:type III pantothenate kinase